MSIDFPHPPSENQVYVGPNVTWRYSNGAWRNFDTSIGSSGISGYSGISISGFSGYSGVNSSAGISGYSGRSGFSGYSGASGLSGFSGYSGPNGFSGASGTSGSAGAGVNNYIAYIYATTPFEIRDTSGVQTYIREQQEGSNNVVYLFSNTSGVQIGADTDANRMNILVNVGMEINNLSGHFKLTAPRYTKTQTGIVFSYLNYIANPE